MGKNEYTPEEQVKAVYALNMCTVAVSQIVDFNDLYLLEEQYDNILNNLNLEAMPDDDALLNILSEMLNTITFFRIQNMKKEQIEKDYQRRLKNAVWSAIPSFNIFVSGNPIAMVASIATTVGTGYMNYRREKYSAATEKERSEMELQITAIEQFDALRRELFTTAWRLSSKYRFADGLRLTERQIHQYNSILLEPNELKKHARLEVIKSQFEAYPPFWYSMANSAMYIAETVDDSSVAEKYRELAHEHYERYFALNKYSILREDKTYATAVIEYCDILIHDDIVKNRDKIKEFLMAGIPKAGNSLDILQLYALEFLKIGENGEAAKVLKLLVNEDYNQLLNAKILSRIYVGICIKEGLESGAYENYQLLKATAPTVGMFPMPTIETLKAQDIQGRLGSEYLIQQKSILKKEYMLALHYVYRRYSEEFSEILPVNRLISDVALYSVESMDTISAPDNEALAKIGFRYRYVDKLNEFVSLLDELPIFRESGNRKQYIKLLEIKVQEARNDLLKYQIKMTNSTLTKSELKELVDNYNFAYFTNDFLRKLRSDIEIVLDGAADDSVLDQLDLQLLDFCQNNYIDIFSNNVVDNKDDIPSVDTLTYGLLEKVDQKSGIINKRKELIERSIKDFEISAGADKDYSVVLYGSELQSYLIKIESNADDSLNSDLIAVLSEPNNDKDILFTPEGFIIAKKGKLSSRRSYSLIKKKTVMFGTTVLDVGFGEVYKTKDVDVDLLYDLIQTIVCIIKENR